MIQKKNNTLPQGCRIRRETPDDYRAVETLVRDSFWNVYLPGAMEHFVLHRMRNDANFVPELDLVFEKDEKLIGQVVYYRSHIDCAAGPLPILTFGPICIANEYKRKGYGKLLLDESMQRARDLGAGALAITGNLDFYGKSGFTVAKERGIVYADDPSADYFLIKELKPGFLNGVHGSYRDPECYFVCRAEPEAFRKFDETFPFREKKKSDGQIF